METDSNPLARKRYVRSLVALDLGILIIGSSIALVFKLNIGLILLLSGILVGGIGAFLTDQTALDPTIAKDIPSKHFLEFMPPETGLTSNQISQKAENTVPRYGIGNMMTLAGFIIVALSVPLLIVMRFSK
jgi:hypothetical protein